MCCEDKISDSPDPDMKCCKDVLINTDTHDCCNSSVPVHKKDGFFCCAEVNVYHNATMTCDEISGKVHLRPSFFNMFFNPADLCTLEAGWRPLTFNDFLGITITGMVDSCNIKSRRRELIIPLSPFSVTSNGLPVNLEGDENVFKVRVRFNKKCHDRISALMSSLKKKALVVHTTNTSFLSKRKPELLIQRGEKSFVSLREAKLDIVQAQSILLSMKRS
ncbi:uncharacterized protein LOC112571078 [Pomacea canaliculata]|uniref:uncharacterized protein LOC112571078 n=1 Tax=Pomacea canaliculata TaxID=400727 RepID=UPI000D72A7C2|nr:uncharacterized protein LOC112571078 [Pomacea canaliculata]